MIVVVDNYDSFVHNLARYLQRLGQQTRVVRNDAVTAAELAENPPDAIVLSPGPCTPDEAGASLDIVRSVAPRVPILGVCLGHQAIAQALGGRIVRAAEPCHGRQSLVRHREQGTFAGLPDPLRCGRYHSLVVEESSLPADLVVTARTEDGAIMALEHRVWPLVGWQFHPESILTEHGYDLLAAFLHRAGLAVVSPRPDFSTEHPAPATRERALPARPVTF